jgi:hypothetical protein
MGRSGASPTSFPHTVSLGIGQIAADKAAEQPTSETVSSRECPLMTLVNCTLIARRPSAKPDISPVGADRARVMRCRWSLMLAGGRCRCCQPPSGEQVAGRDQAVRVLPEPHPGPRAAVLTPSSEASRDGYPSLPDPHDGCHLDTLVLLTVPDLARPHSRPAAIGMNLPTPPPTRLLPNPGTDGFCQGRLRVYMNQAPLTGSGCPTVTDGPDRFRESQILLRRVGGRPPTFPPKSLRGKTRYSLGLLDRSCRLDGLLL